MEMAEYHDSYMDVSWTVCYIMAAILNFKMADKLIYFQIRPYIMFEILGITNICVTTILAKQLCLEYHP